MEFDWVNYSDERLLELRLCDLGLRLENSPIAARIRQLYRELDARNLALKPHVWFSDDWFSPDGVPGIAIPFYMAHPRLARLERSMMYEVEGGNKDWCMKILRHEAGHALDTAYRIHRRQKYREVFGKYSAPYPSTYRPKPFSKDYVLHLEPWYAQSHPAEDFAETFAVWLAPRSRWRSVYEHWPALQKLEYVHTVMQNLAGASPAVYTRRHIDPLKAIKITLGEHYARRRSWYGFGQPTRFDEDLKRLFAPDCQEGLRRMAATYLQRERQDLTRRVASLTGEYEYNVRQVLREMIERCREMNLRMPATLKAQRTLKKRVMDVLATHTMQFLHGGWPQLVAM